jgi:hypothetical protein
VEEFGALSVMAGVVLRNFDTLAEFQPSVHAFFVEPLGKQSAIRPHQPELKANQASAIKD